MRRLQQKIIFYRGLIIEILETLCTICWYLERDGRMCHNQVGELCGSHFTELNRYSQELRDMQNKDLDK